MIGICDDEVLVIEQLKAMIKDLARESRIDCEISLYCSGEELLASDTLPDLVFLDIEMPEMDGYEVGRRIKECNPDCELVMATSQVERYKEAFYVKAIRFITKPFCREEVKEALVFFTQKIWSCDYVEMYAQRICYKVRQKDIPYFRAYNGYIESSVKSMTFRKDCSLNQIYEELEKKLFIKISRSYIINVAYISKFENNKIIIDDIILNVPRRMKQEVRQAWINYDLNVR